MPALIIEAGIRGKDYSLLDRVGIPYEVWWLGRRVKQTTAALRAEVARRQPACVIAAGNVVAGLLLSERHFSDPLVIVAPRVHRLWYPDGSAIPMVIAGPFTTFLVRNWAGSLTKALRLVLPYVKVAAAPSQETAPVVTPAPAPVEEEAMTDDEKPHWQVAAEDAVIHALKRAEIDRERGTVTIDGQMFADLEALRAPLIEEAENAWKANAPSREFDEFVSECDSDAIVDESLEEARSAGLCRRTTPRAPAPRPPPGARAHGRRPSH